MFGNNGNKSLFGNNNNNSNNNNSGGIFGNNNNRNNNNSGGLFGGNKFGKKMYLYNKNSSQRRFFLFVRKTLLSDSLFFFVSSGNIGSLTVISGKISPSTLQIGLFFSGEGGGGRGSTGVLYTCKKCQLLYQICKLRF